MEEPERTGDGNVPLPLCVERGKCLTKPRNQIFQQKRLFKKFRKRKKTSQKRSLNKTKDTHDIVLLNPRFAFVIYILSKNLDN